MDDNGLAQLFAALPLPLRFFLLGIAAILGVLLLTHPSWIEAIIHLLQSVPLVVVLPLPRGSRPQRPPINPDPKEPAQDYGPAPKPHL